MSGIPMIAKPVVLGRLFNRSRFRTVRPMAAIPPDGYTHAQVSTGEEVYGSLNAMIYQGPRAMVTRHVQVKLTRVEADRLYTELRLALGKPN